MMQQQQQQKKEEEEKEENGEKEDLEIMEVKAMEKNAEEMAQMVLSPPSRRPCRRLQPPTIRALAVRKTAETPMKKGVCLDSA